jgi:hypothetical protein
MKKYCLLEGVVRYLHTLVYTQELERCSILYEVENKNGTIYLEYDPKKEQVGKKESNKEGNRQRCDSENFHHIVHTHPLSEYPYPSIGDIWRIVEEPSVKLEVIATSWGIYTLKQKEKFKGLDWINDLRANNYEQGFKDWVTGVLNNIHRLHDKKKNRDINNYILTPVEYGDVNLFLSNINKEMDIEIKLYPWQSIRFSKS